MPKSCFHAPSCPFWLAYCMRIIYWIMCTFEIIQWLVCMNVLQQSASLDCCYTLYSSSLSPTFFCCISVFFVSLWRNGETTKLRTKYTTSALYWNAPSSFFRCVNRPSVSPSLFVHHISVDHYYLSQRIQSSVLPKHTIWFVCTANTDNNSREMKAYYSLYGNRICSV